MTNGGDAAEQVVRLSLEGFEVAAKLSGAAAKNIAVLLVSVYKHGEVTIKHSSISVLSIDPEELPEESYGETNYELLSDEDFEVNKNLF